MSRIASPAALSIAPGDTAHAHSGQEIILVQTIPNRDCTKRPRPPQNVVSSCLVDSAAVMEPFVSRIGTLLKEGNLSRSHYTDTDPTSRGPDCARLRLEPATSGPRIEASTN
ncbi:hypothetical protein ElyMa_000294300 [Elysia marginata]|uniref:Uncharacterized protein n=1 Tax=Elysia marginata TaxID=1093978 RepID=A0AAV4F7B6_9GAST|nr:hypothetical protein ElyMa_000294300 [Elysia marginata]